MKMASPRFCVYSIIGAYASMYHVHVLSVVSAFANTSNVPRVAQLTAALDCTKASDFSMRAVATVAVGALALTGLFLMLTSQSRQLSEYHPCRLFPANSLSDSGSTIVLDDSEDSSGPTVPLDKSVESTGPNVTVPEVAAPPKKSEFWMFKGGHKGPFKHEMDEWMGEQCSEIWDEWMKVARSVPPKEPPMSIPKDMWKDYTLWGRIPVHKLYFDEVTVPKKKVWGSIDAQMLQPKEQLIRESTYRVSTANLYHAMDYYQKYVEGMSGVVIGSQRPWCELYALRHGAREVTTVEYQDTEIVTTKYKMNYIHPFKMAADWERYDSSFDFAISYSSIEHSGLGRYGDPLDPFGDLRETSKVRCMLKPGGIFFLAVPTGRDALYWNAHRVYGPVRLPWLIKGFNLLGVFLNRTQREPTPGLAYTAFEKGGYFQQPLLVLQKM